jgi:hypothetical protein
MGTVGNFFPTILNSLGYNTTITLLLTAPPYSTSDRVVVIHDPCPLYCTICGEMPDR